MTTNLLKTRDRVAEFRGAVWTEQPRHNQAVSEASTIRGLSEMERYVTNASKGLKCISSLLFLLLQGLPRTQIKEVNAKCDHATHLLLHSFGFVAEEQL